MSLTMRHVTLTAFFHHIYLLLLLLLLSSVCTYIFVMKNRICLENYMRKHYFRTGMSSLAVNFGKEQIITKLWRNSLKKHRKNSSWKKETKRKKIDNVRGIIFMVGLHKEQNCQHQINRSLRRRSLKFMSLLPSSSLSLLLSVWVCFR